MKIKNMDKLFWNYFKICPRKACLSYIKHHHFRKFYVVDTYKRLTVDEQKYKILEDTTNKFFQTLIKEGSVTIPQLRTIFLILIQKARERVLSNTYYSSNYKNEFLEMIADLRTLKDFNILTEILIQEDAINIETGIKAKVSLKEFASQGREPLKEEYEYNLEIPFYKRVEDNKVAVIKYIHTGFPYDIPELNAELIILNSFFNKCTDEELAYTIVYDFKSMKRYEVKNIFRGYEHIYSMLYLIDNNLVYANNTFENCRTCVHKKICVDTKNNGELLFGVDELYEKKD